MIVGSSSHRSSRADPSIDHAFSSLILFEAWDNEVEPSLTFTDLSVPHPKVHPRIAVQSADFFSSEFVKVCVIGFQYMESGQRILLAILGFCIACRRGGISARLGTGCSAIRAKTSSSSTGPYSQQSTPTSVLRPIDSNAPCVCP